MEALDFTISGPVWRALVAVALQPLCLFLLSRWRAIKGRNAVQFAISFVVVVAFWASSIARYPSNESSEIAAGLMILAAGGLFYLEIWALISRGYTFAILVALLAARRPLQESELSLHYRGGEGLSWIMRHRVEGLISVRLVEKREENLVLTPFLGVAVARLYRLSIRLVGLRKAG